MFAVTAYRSLSSHIEVFHPQQLSLPKSFFRKCTCIQWQLYMCKFCTHHYMSRFCLNTLLSLLFFSRKNIFRNLCYKSFDLTFYASIQTYWPVSSIAYCGSAFGFRIFLQAGDSGFQICVSSLSGCLEHLYVFLFPLPNPALSSSAIRYRQSLHFLIFLSVPPDSLYIRLIPQLIGFILTALHSQGTCS